MTPPPNLTRVRQYVANGALLGHDAARRTENGGKCAGFSGLLPPSEKTEEPIVLAALVVPEDLVVDVQLLCFCPRGTPKTLEAFNGKRVLITYEFPFAEVLIDFFDRLQSISHGYASFDYEPAR